MPLKPASQMREVGFFIGQQKGVQRMEQKPQIEIRGLCKDYPIPGGEVHALSNISLTIDKGDIYGIIGMSGAGQEHADPLPQPPGYPHGRADLHRRRKHPGHEQAAASPDPPPHGDDLPAVQPADAKVRGAKRALPLEIAGVPKKQANERVIELLRIVGLEDKAGAYPAQLSGGQKQRVAIARALASDPEMLLCDEATSALDPMTTQSILALLQKINRELGITVVLITHEMAVIRQICNKVAILDGGKLAEQGTVDDVFMHTKSAAGRRLFGILPDQEEIPPQPAIRIVFDGEAAEKPIISKLVKDCGLEVNILSADIRQLNQKAYGQMMIARPQDPEDVKRVMEYLTREGLTVEEVHVP